ncbi:hypothetical protein F4781DRAFT_434713 [Annulohypoxylon bovei var. microspora]|nr:hypothetical protein F4781DRAFT_434713 [Annulohypoxylon bovei var. microspora]
MHDSGNKFHKSRSQSQTQSQQLQHLESIYNPQNYDLEDWQRDVPQALLFPHSLDTAAPGRQVLLRHQRVLLAPPTPPPSTTGFSEMDDKQGSPAGSWMAVKVQRVKRWWISLKQRATPKLFPQAWFLFVIIILIAVGAIVTGWGGLAVETARHQTLTSASGSSATSAARPAPPNLEASASGITTSGLTWPNPTGYGTATMVKGTAWSPRSTLAVTGDILSAPSANLTSARRHVVKDIITDYAITHVTSYLTEYVTEYVTTVYTTGALTAEATANHDSGSGLSMSSMSSASPTTTALTSATTSDPMFCPDPHHPGAWTICAVVQEVTALGTTSHITESAANRQMFNPFTFTKNLLKGVWDMLFNYDKVRAEAMRQVSRYNVYDLGCQCGDLQRLMLVMVDIIDVQQRMLEDQEVRIKDLKLLFSDQEAALEGNKGRLADVVEFVAIMKNDTEGM